MSRTIYIQLLVLITLGLGNLSHADINTASRYVQDADLVGKARMKVMLWNVFDATLYAPQGQFSSSEPFALSLSYLRELKGEKIVSTTIEEMAAQKKFSQQELADWKIRLSSMIGDVQSGTTITGIRDINGHTLLYRNGQPVGQITDERFTQGFFNIWLGNTSSQPQLRKRLLGLQQS